MKIPVLYKAEKGFRKFRDSVKWRIWKKIKKYQDKKIARITGLPPVLSWYWYKKEALKLHRNDVRILVLGSSHGQSAVNTDLIPGSFNLSIASQDMYQSFKLYEKYADYLPKLDTVVLFFSVFSSGAEMQKTVNVPLCQYYKAVFDIDFKYPWEGKYCGKEIKWMADRLPPVNPAYKGYEPVVGQFKYETAYGDLIAHIKHALRGNHQEDYVRQIYELAEKHGHRLIVVIPPHSPEYRRVLDEECRKKGVDGKTLFYPLFAVRQKCDFDLLDYFSDDRFTNDDFWDWEHLNPAGATKFCNLLKPRVQVPDLSTVIMDISGYCNARCPFCPRQVLKPELSGFMSDEVFYTSIKQLENIPTCKSITLAAEGEPLMHPHFDEYVRYLKSKNFIVSLPTNMSLAHKHFDALLECDNVMFSIEGWDKESYEKSRVNLNYETVVDNIKTFSRLVNERRKKGKHTPETSINLIVTKETKVIDFIEQWKDFTDFIRIGPIGPNMDFDPETKSVQPAANDAMKEILLPLENNPVKYCVQPFTLTLVKANGKMGLCCSDYNITLDFGDYRNIEENFYKNKELRRIRREFSEQSLTTCKNCPQHLMITRAEYEKWLPEIRDIEKRYPNVTVYALR